MAFNCGAATSGSITICQVFEGTNSVEFTFESTWPPGTSYQPQFLQQVGGTWADLPDARIEEVDGAHGLYHVSAPQFGGVSGFYRVINSVSLPDDPVPSTIDEPNIDELFVMWTRLVPLPQTGTAIQFSGKVYDYLESPAGGPITNSFEANATTRFSLNGNLSIGQDILMSDLDGDGRVDPLMVWLGLDGEMYVSIAQVISTNLSISQGVTFPLTNRVVRTDSSVPPLIRVLRANFPNAQNPRIWLAWVNTSRNVEFELIEFRQNLSEYATLASFTVTPGVAFDSPGNPLDRSGWFDAVSGDFDGDGDDELALLTTENVSIPNGSGNWQLYTRFFKYLPDTPPFLGIDTIPDPDRVLYVKGGTSSILLSRLAGHADDFDGDGRDELAVVYETGDNSSVARWYLQFLKPDATFSSLVKEPAQATQIDQNSGNIGYPLDLQTGEFDGDALPELVIGSRKIQLFDVRTNLTYSKLTEDGLALDPNSTARRFMTLANLDSRDPNTGFRPEIVVAAVPDNGLNRLQIQSYKVNGDSNTFYRIDQDAIINDDSFLSSSAPVAVGAADFGHNGLKLGTPRRYTRTVTGRPVVIVNAPPVHFDVFDGISYDVNNMFPTSECINSPTLCPFYSRYTVASTTSIEVQTDWERGWNVGVKVKGGVELPLDVGLKAEIQTKFGERFDSFASSNETTKVEVQVDAVADDRIYASTINYTVWEYPVIMDGEIVTYIIAYAPDVTRQNWFGSKSIIAQNYQPYHEVGNLLSYRPTIEPYPGADYVRMIDSADTFTVDSSSAYVWRLTRTVSTTTSESRSFNFNIQAKASFDIPVPWIPDVTVSGGYDSTSLHSSTTELTDQQGLVSTLGALDGSIAGTAYSITPYFYWDRSGALVLDYAVDLSAGTPGQPTFWGQRYSAKSDPAFVLPWRLDPEKGLAILNESQRQLTREIVTIPPEPRPGEDVDLIARISNFSFLSTPSSFRVRFYLGDPANGGTLLINNNGANNVLVNAGIPARGKQLVHFPWRVPESITSASIQIYCVIDADHQLDEIHEDNNVGWNEIFIRNQP